MAASAASSLVPSSRPIIPTPPGCALDMNGGTLFLSGRQMQYLRFPGEEGFWMPAKPLMTSIGEANVTQFTGRVPECDKTSFENLIGSKGGVVPPEAYYGFITPPTLADPNDRKAIWINESGFWKVVITSKSQGFQPLQYWLTSVVLPALVRTGSYSVAPGSAPSSAAVAVPNDIIASAFRNELREHQADLVLALRERDQQFEQRLAIRDQKQQAALIEHEQRLVARLGDEFTVALRAHGQHLEQGQKTILAHYLQEFKDQLVAAVQQASTQGFAQLETNVLAKCKEAFTLALKQCAGPLARNVTFSVSQRLQDVRDVIVSALTKPKSSYIDALRQAVKKPALKSTSDAERFPDDQRVSAEEERYVVSLSVVLAEELKQVDAARRLPGAPPLPALTYGAWKKCRSLVGTRCFAARKRLAAAGSITKPKLWSTSSDGGRTSGGGQHYVYLSESSKSKHLCGSARDLVRKVLKQKKKRSSSGSPPQTIEQHIRELIAESPPELWPTSTSALDYYPMMDEEEGNDDGEAAASAISIPELEVVAMLEDDD